MDITLKLLKDYGDFKAGELVDVDEKDVDAIIEQGIAEKYVPVIPVKAAVDKAVETLEKRSGEGYLHCEKTTGAGIGHRSAGLPRFSKNHPQASIRRCYRYFPRRFF